MGLSSQSASLTSNDRTMPEEPPKVDLRIPLHRKHTGRSFCNRSRFIFVAVKVGSLPTSDAAQYRRDLSHPHGKDGPDRPLTIRSDAAMQPSHCGHLCVTQQFQRGSDCGAERLLKNSATKIFACKPCAGIRDGIRMITRESA